jgi:lipopolysaccharide transport system ATP-binding protein
MSDVAIRVANLGKQYDLDGKWERYATLRDAVTDAVSTPFRRLRSRLSRRSDVQRIDDNTIWALQNVSFEVERGEVVGVIGPNGAGKTTLLKILSRITEPTKGYAAIRGRVGSLLEVGTGFHPELTGRENIYLNGAILGMRRAEIHRKFDEIVAFAEIQKFIDTPVKRYSSGMHMRLAFAVAAHLEPEIMLVDEVLAVGDARFQKKCLNKMQDVGQEGRTVLFVSHNMPAITRLCERTILLDQGGLLADGPSPKVVSAYLNSGFGTAAVREWPDATKAPGGEVARLRAVRVRTEDGQIVDSLDIRRPVGVEMEYDVLKPGRVLLPNFHFYNEQGVEAFAANDLDPDWRGRPRPAGRYVSTAWIPGNLLTEGTLFVRSALITVDPIIVQFSVGEAVAFRVIDSLDGGDSARGDYAGPMRGVVRPLLRWSTQFTPLGREYAELLTEKAEA